MPYIITTHPQGGRRNPETGSWHDAPRSDDTGITLSGRSRWLSAPGESHRAVATLDEAQEEACEAVHRAFDQPGYDANHAESPDLHGAALDAANALPEAGGTVGPLPDGTVIEVRRVNWPELGDLAGRLYSFAEYEQTIDAYNAREAS